MRLSTWNLLLLFSAYALSVAVEFRFQLNQQYKCVIIHCIHYIFPSNVNLDVVLTLLEISKRSIRKKRTISQVLLCYCILDRFCGCFYPSSSEKITGWIITYCSSPISVVLWHFYSHPDIHINEKNMFNCVTCQYLIL